MIRQRQKQWKTAVAVLAALLSVFAQSICIAEVPAPPHGWRTSSAGMTTPARDPALREPKAGAAAGAADADEVIIVNNVWVDVPLTQVFRDISVQTDVVIALCPHVPDPLISLDAGSGKPLEECLQELVAGRGLFIYPRNKRFYLISCADPACPSFLEVAESKRLYLKYITAKHLMSSLPLSVQKYVSSGERPNEMLIYTVPEIMKRIMGIVQKLDVPRPQVVMEVLVVELQEEASDEFGFDWEYQDRHNSFSMTGAIGAFTGLARYTSVPESDITGLLFTLRALVRERKASIRSRPRVATLNGQKATIDISLEEYFTVVTDFYDTSRLRTKLEVIKSGVLLNMTPHIGDNGDITVDVLTEVSDVVSRQNQVAGNISGDLPIVRRRMTDTCVRVKQGDAIVIGGLIETQEQSEDKSVPVLSSIPFVGGIFKSTDNSTIEKEVVIFITPRLMEEGKNPLSDRHELLDVAEELDALRDAVTLLDGQHPPHQDDRAEELDALRDAVDLLNGQHPPHQDDRAEELDTLRDAVDLLNGQHPPHHNLPSTDDRAEKVEVLREVVGLLDMQHPPHHNLSGIDKQRESSRSQSP